MIIIANGFAIGNETAGHTAKFVGHCLRQADNESLFVDAFEVIILFANQ